MLVQYSRCHAGQTWCMLQLKMIKLISRLTHAIKRRIRRNQGLGGEDCHDRGWGSCCLQILNLLILLGGCCWRLSLGF